MVLACLVKRRCFLDFFLEKQILRAMVKIDNEKLQSYDWMVRIMLASDIMKRFIKSVIF